MSPSPRRVLISMSLRWRMPCCAAPAPEPHEPDTARPHTSPTTPPTGGAGKVRSKSGRLDVIRHFSLITQHTCLRLCNRRHACEKCGLNRSAVLAGIGASGGTEKVYLQGAGISWQSVAAKPGRYQLVISIITPNPDLVSDGKAPDFGNLAGQLGELVGRTMKSARRGVPPDDATPEEIAAAEAEAKADKQAKEAEAKRRDERRQQREADQAAWRTAGGARVLLRTIGAETAAAGVSANDLTVGGPRSDPFRMDTPADHRISKWLVDRVPAGRKIHL